MKGGRIGISGHGEDPIHTGGGRPGVFNLVLLPTHHSQRYSISAHCSKKSRQDSAINVQKAPGNGGPTVICWCSVLSPRIERYEPAKDVAKLRPSDPGCDVNAPGLKSRDENE
ncbi:hypothetical protein NL676_010094 [Syzygium grande]|nr:hypothetical protein NL676_010094 [Syzygium grande]